MTKRRVGVLALVAIAVVAVRRTVPAGSVTVTSANGGSDTEDVVVVNP